MKRKHCSMLAMVVLLGALLVSCKQTTETSIDTSTTPSPTSEAPTTEPTPSETTQTTAELDPSIVVLPPFDAEKKVDPNTVPFTKESFTINGHTNEYDVVTMPTKSIKVDESKPTMDYNEKLSKMFWSVQPPLGLIEGDYYKKAGYFNGDPKNLAVSSYIAIVEVVKNQDKIVQVELNEIAPQDYYEPRFQGVSKRLSEYGFFQVESQRTDSTLVNLNNAFTYMEQLMVNENRLTGEFKTIKGQSNSLYTAFIPLAEMLNEELSAPSGQYYYAYAEKLPSGLTPRLQVITENGKIIKAHYDEIFADTQEEIQDEKLKKYYRTSKYHSIYYSPEIGEDFKSFSDALEKSIIESQDLTAVPADYTSNAAFSDEVENYKKMAEQVQSAMKP